MKAALAIHTNYRCISKEMESLKAYTIQVRSLLQRSVDSVDTLNMEVFISMRKDHVKDVAMKDPIIPKYDFKLHPPAAL